MDDYHPCRLAKLDYVSIPKLDVFKLLHRLVVDCGAVRAPLVVKEDFTGPPILQDEGVLAGQTWVLHVHEVSRKYTLRGLSSNCDKASFVEIECAK